MPDKKYIVKCYKCKIPTRRETQRHYKCLPYKNNSYLKGWHSISLKIRKEHPYCSVCKRGKDEVLLHVDHIDKNKKNNNLDNLRVLCIQCHLSLHHNEDKKLLKVDYQLHGIRLIYEPFVAYQ